MHETKSTCCYCGVGCGLIIESAHGRITGVRGDPEHPANFGRLCSKGATLHLSARADARALHPEMRLTRTAARERVSWDGALDLAAERFAQTIRRHGPDSVAFYISGQLLTEDYYVFNKLAKGLIGTNNIDTNSRLCMSSAVAGYKATLGADAPPACYQDIGHARCIFIAGSNTAYAHPVVFRRIEDARALNPELKIVVVDPRRTDTAACADLHLAILPGTDVALFNAMLHVMLWDGMVDREYILAHTEGFDALKQMLREYTPESAAQICGVGAADIITAAHWFATATPTLSLYCQGLNQSVHGTDNNAALINLHLATAQIGKPGAGPLSLTGQPNAMGGREVGGMANLLSAHRDLGNAAHRREVAELWGVADVPAQPGKSAVNLFRALHEGEVKAVWIACTNPAQSMPDAGFVQAALARADFVVLQEAYRNTDTAQFADVLLPAASWGEKEGTVTNSERAISRVRAAAAAPGSARPDWEIAVDFALRLGARLGDARALRMFPYQGPEQVFDEHRESTRGRDLDITGLSYRKLEAEGPQQWPLREGEANGRARLYEDGIFPTPSGRARFVCARHHGTHEKVDARYPLHLNTGRLRDQWHGMSRTGTVARLFNHAPEPSVMMHPNDARRRRLVEGDLVRIKSRRGELVLRLALSADMRPAQVFMPMHWGSQFMSGAGVNALTLSAFDPISHQPELKHAAVQVEKAELPWQMSALVRLDPAEGLAPMLRLQGVLARFPYASLGLFGREREFIALRAADLAPPEPALLAEIDAMLRLDDAASALSYQDHRRGIRKRISFDDGKVVAVQLVGETAAHAWLKDLMASESDAGEVRRWMLAPVAAPPAGSACGGRVVCNCLDVSERQIVAALARGTSFEVLCATLKCGTSCGSCVPELKRMCAGKAGQLEAAA